MAIRIKYDIKGKIKLWIKTIASAFIKKYSDVCWGIFDQNIKWSRYTIESPNISEYYNYFIAGSDQIWNPLFECNSDREFLTFTANEKKIAYAASIGLDELPINEADRYRKYISSFKNVSVREKTAADIIENLGCVTFIICWGAGFCSVCLLCLYQPFMELWVGKDLMLSFLAVICFVVYFFVRQMNSLFNMYKDASGMWHEDRFRPLVAALTNLVLNLILVQLIGIYGILISTVVAIICVGMPWLLRNLFTVIFERKHFLDYLKKLLYYCIIILISCIVTYAICAKINFGLLTTLIVRGVVCVVIPNIIYLVAYKKKTEFKDSLALVNKMTNGKLKGLFSKLGMIEY